jgi:hypothetical protein
VTYNCTLNENAKHGTPGNPNKVGLKFSNKPDWTGNGNPPEGTTPEDTVIVFTYKTEVNKTDNQGNDLPNAGFTLYKRYSSAAKLPAGVTNEYSTLAALTGVTRTISEVLSPSRVTNTSSAQTLSGSMGSTSTTHSSNASSRCANTVGFFFTCSSS